MTTNPDELVGKLRADIEAIQWGDRPLPWVVHSGCSYRRIASEPTRENGCRTFPDGNVLHAYNQRSDNHPDLSMGERELEALVRLVNALPSIADRITSLQDRIAQLEEALRNEAIPTLAAVRATTRTEQWDEAREHFSNLALETIKRCNDALRAAQERKS
jgi:hypothetical protein